MMVWWPTSIPATSVMAFNGPGVPSKGTPRSRARGPSWAMRGGHPPRKHDGDRESSTAETGREALLMATPPWEGLLCQTASAARRAPAAAGRDRAGTADASGRARTAGRPPGTGSPAARRKGPCPRKPIPELRLVETHRRGCPGSGSPRGAARGRDGASPATRRTVPSSSCGRPHQDEAGGARPRIRWQPPGWPRVRSR